MIRDPFDIHRKNNIFQTTALRAAQNIRNKAAQVGTNALEMSFSIPKNVPNFRDPHRRLEDHAWAAVSKPGAAQPGGIFSDMQNKVSGFFDDDDELPMYKDKPRGYAPSTRRRRWWKRKRVLASIAIVVTFLLWVTGFFSSHQGDRHHSSSAWSWLAAPGDKGVVADWDKRRSLVVEAFELSWDSYERHAWGYDEYHPEARTGKYMAPKGLGWIIIDSLDTMMLMNLTSRLHHAREWISDTLTWDQDQDVNTFETTIRMLGGLLSAHYLSTEFPELAPLPKSTSGTADDEDLYLEKARDLADRLMAAFDSESGVPYSSVNLKEYKGLPSHADGGAASTAEATTLQLEFKYLAKLTGEKSFWDAVEKVMQVVDNNNAEGGLVPIYIHPTKGEFQSQNIRLGSRGDSYYEYLIKQYLQTNKNEPVYQEMWKDSLKGVREHLVTYSEPSRFTIIGERPDGLKGRLSPKMDHLVCFMPGTIALAVTGGLTEAEARALATWTKQDDADMQLARELTQTCWGMYKYMATGLAAEITHFQISDPPLPESAPHKAPSTFDKDPEAKWRSDYSVKSNDVHNLQRPETVESLFYMWRITGDVQYREWGWQMFESFMNYTAVSELGGFTSLIDANVIPPISKDNMESFWLAETLKYMYLLFSPNELLPLDKIVLNTEAHPLPRFDMGHFTTGWQRKARDASGKIVA